MNKNENSDQGDASDQGSTSDQSKKVDSGSVSDTNSTAPLKRSSEKVSRKSQRKVSRPVKSDLAGLRKKTNPMVWLLVVINLLFSLLFAAAAFYAWLHWQSLEEKQNAREALLQTQVTTDVSARFSELAMESKAQANELLMDVAAKNSLIDAKVQQLAETLAESSKESETEPKFDMSLSELKYLVRMAERKALLEKNFDDALEVLQQLKGLLIQSNDLNHLSLREAVATDIQSIKAVQIDNPVDLAVDLTGLLSVTDDLQFLSPDAQYGEVQLKPTDNIADWRQNVAIFFDNVTDNFFNYDGELQEPIEPYLSIQQQTLIKTSLQYNLLSARHAVIVQERKLFNASISAAFELLSKFDTSQSHFKVFENSLRKLSSAPFPEKLQLKMVSMDALNAITDEEVVIAEPQL